MATAIEAADLKTYREWSPTAFDARGLALAERQDWLVCPVMKTRDSDALERSNFDAFERIIAAQSGTDDHETHRFGHWGPGWFEIILVRPGSPAHKEAAELACALASYPVLDDALHYEYEHDTDDGRCENRDCCPETATEES